MNNQLEKLQQKPKVHSFRPVTIHLNKKNKLNNDTEKVIQKIIDKTGENVDRNEMLKRFSLSKIQAKKISETPKKIIEIEVNKPELSQEIEKKDKVLTSVIEALETSRIIRSSKEDLEKEGENIEREYDLELEQKIQQDIQKFPEQFQQFITPYINE